MNKPAPWSIGLGAIALAVAVAGPSGLATAFELDRSALAAGEWWRVLTSHWAHWSTNHLIWDATALGVLLALAWRESAQRALVARSEAWLRDNAPDLATKGVGVAVMFSYISERNINSMLSGSVFGLILISVILIIALRSVKIGLLSLIPNLLPIGLTFGIWGMMVGQVNMAASVVTGMVLGIVVDDTVHFLSKYLRARRENGLSPEDAVRYAFSTVGMALVVTTIVLIAGFLVLAQSDFAINSTMAILTAMAIAIALAVDFLLLPPILLKFDGADGALVNPDLRTDPENSHEPSLA